MALKLILKPGEKIIINKAVIVNGNHKSEFILQNKSQVMREKDILTQENATTPAKRVYFTIQMMYLFPENEEDHKGKFNIFLKQFIDAVPSSKELSLSIYDRIQNGEIYGALRECKKLIDYENEILKAADEVQVNAN